MQLFWATEYATILIRGIVGDLDFQYGLSPQRALAFYIAFPRNVNLIKYSAMWFFEWNHNFKVISIQNISILLRY